MSAGLTGENAAGEYKADNGQDKRVDHLGCQIPDVEPFYLDIEHEHAGEEQGERKCGI